MRHIRERLRGALEDKSLPLSRSTLRLSAWLLLVFLGETMAPRSYPGPGYPTLFDGFLMVLVPVGAFHSAKFCQTGLLFLLYGCLASLIFILTYTETEPIDLMLRYERTTVLGVTAKACFLTLGMAIACRYAMALRGFWDARHRHPSGYCSNCGYNLTGNTSGICPECGTPTRGAKPRPSD